jgi:hypothetical protein
MKPLSFLCVLLALAFGSAATAPDASASGSLDAYRKNLARHHLGTNLLLYSADRAAYEPTEAAAAWIDDDVATGWPAATGKRHYLIALAEPALATNFALSTRQTSGKINLFAADEPLPPGNPGWASVAKNIGIESINNAKLATPLNRLAKYFLIEIETVESGPIYSLYLFGNKPATDYHLWKREASADTASALGGYVNEATGINVAGLYAGSRVVGSESANTASFQTAIDDDPETALTISASDSRSSLMIRFDKPQTVRRISLQTQQPTKGTIEFFVDTSASDPATDAAGTKVASLRFDGSSDRSSAEFTAAEGSTLSARWIPDTAGESLAVREVNTFGDVTPANYALSNPEAIGEGGQLLADDKSKGGKEALPPIAEGPGDLMKSPYLPGPYGPPPEFPRDFPVSP